MGKERNGKLNSKEMKCFICGGSDIETVDTVVSDFVMDRISLHNFTENRKTKLCFCHNCTFAFYEYRMTDEEDKRLYADYRGEEYQKTREKYECWYTKKVNNALNSDKTALSEQKRVIEKIVKYNVEKELQIALDYGGNEGKTFTDLLGTREKYVFDISGVKTVEGVIGISEFDDLKKHSYDFIMCNMLFEHLVDPVGVMDVLREIGNEETIYYIEVPSENPFTSGNKFSIKNNLSLLFNPNYSNIRLIRYYLQQRMQPFMPMKEHINFYTKESIKKMVELSGFRVIDIQENLEKAALGNAKVLSILFKK